MGDHAGGGKDLNEKWIGNYDKLLVIFSPWYFGNYWSKNMFFLSLIHKKNPTSSAISSIPTTMSAQNGSLCSGSNSYLFQGLVQSPNSFCPQSPPTFVQVVYLCSGGCQAWLIGRLGFKFFMSSAARKLCDTLMTTSRPELGGQVTKRWNSWEKNPTQSAQQWFGERAESFSLFFWRKTFVIFQHFRLLRGTVSDFPSSD